MATNFLNNNNKTNFTRDFNKKLTDDDPLGLKKKTSALPSATVQQPVASQTVKPAPVVQTLDEALGKTQLVAAPPTRQMGELLQPSKQPFDITQTELFKKSAEATQRQLGGEITGLSEQERIARENLAVAQSQREKQIREGLTTQGFRDTGKFVEEGIIAPKQQQFRERKDLERQLIADRVADKQQTVAQGQAGAQSLLELTQGQAGLRQQQEQEQQKLQSAIDLAKIDQEGKLAITDLQGKIAAGAQIAEHEFQGVESALDRAQGLAEQSNDIEAIQRIEELRAQLSREGLVSGERIAFAQIASEEGLAALDQQGREAIVELQGRINEGLTITQGQIRGAENALDRAHALAVQANDIAAQGEIEKMRNELALKGFASQEKIAMARITSDEALANLNINAQESLLRLKDELDTGRLMTQQEFAASQAELANQHDLAVQDNDINAQKEIEKMQGDLQIVMQEKQQEFQEAQRVATQSWQTDERLGQQDFVNAENFLDREQQIALQNNDIEAQLKIADDRNMLQLKLQTNDMTHDEKMSHLNFELEDARANNDVDRQKNIMTFAHTQEMDRISQEQGFEKSMAYVNNELAQALQNNDFENSKVLMELRHTQELKIHQDNLAIDQAKVDLQQAGIDMAKIEQQYNFLQNEVAEGRLDPGVATNFLKESLGSQLPDGFQFTEPDPNAVQDAIAADWVNQQYQYALQQGDADGDGKLDAGVYEVDANGNNVFVGLVGEHAEKFNNHMNETVYGTDTSPSLGGTEIADSNTGNPGDYFFEGNNLYKVGDDGNGTSMTYDEIALALRGANAENNKNYSVYKTLTANSPTANMGIASRRKNTLSGVPPEGDVLKVGDRLMIITRGKYNEKSGRNHQAFEIMDVSTGSKRTFRGLESRDSVINVNSWAENLAG